MKRLVLAAFVIAVLIAALFVRWPAPRGRAWSLYDMFSGFAYLRRLHVEADKKIAALPAERLDRLALQAQHLATTRASDSVLSSTANVTLTVNPVPPPANQPPAVNAGSAQTITLR